MSQVIRKAFRVFGTCTAAMTTKNLTSRDCIEITPKRKDGQT